MFFSKFLKKIKILVNSNKEENEIISIKCNYLTVFITCIKTHTPSNLVEPFFLNVSLPMLLETIKMDSGEDKISSLEALKNVTEKFL